MRKCAGLLVIIALVVTGIIATSVLVGAAKEPIVCFRDKKYLSVVLVVLLCVVGAFLSLYALRSVQNGPYFWRWAILLFVSLICFACGIFMLLDDIGEVSQLREDSVADRYEPLSDDVHTNELTLTRFYRNCQCCEPSLAITDFRWKVCERRRTEAMIGHKLYEISMPSVLPSSRGILLLTERKQGIVTLPSCDKESTKLRNMKLPLASEMSCSVFRRLTMHLASSFVTGRYPVLTTSSICE